MKKEGNWARGKFTFLRLRNILVLPLSFFDAARVFDRKHHVSLVVKPNITVASKVHLEFVVCRLGRSLELHLQSLHSKGRLACLIQDRLVKGGKCEGRNSHFALTGIGEEQMPAG